MIFTRGVRLNISPTLSIGFEKLASEILKPFPSTELPRSLFVFNDKVDFLCFSVTREPSGKTQGRAGMEVVAMMVNVTRQLGQVMGYPDIWVNMISGCVCEVISR